LTSQLAVSLVVAIHSHSRYSVFIPNQKWITRKGLLVLFISLLIILPNASVQADDRTERAPRILLIGNSYTGQIRRTMRTALKSSANPQAHLEFVTKPGAKLHQHLTDETLMERIRQGEWDWVVLQEQSQTPALPGKYRQSFLTSVAKFSKMIEAAGARTALYITWGRRDGDSKNPKLFPDYSTMQQELSAAYELAARTNNAWLVPVGDIWSVVMRKRPELGASLYKPDGSHPSYAGAFLASCVFFRSLLGDSLDTINAEKVLTREELDYVKTIVRDNVRPWTP